MAVSLQDIQAWMNANAGASDKYIATAMQEYGVTPEQMAQATGADLANVTSRYNAVVSPAVSQAAIATQPVSGFDATANYAGISFDPSKERNQTFVNTGMNVKNFMDKAGVDFQRATDLMYGFVGSNADTRNWNAIMSSSDPAKAAMMGVAQMYGGLTGKVGEYTDPETGRITYQYDLYGGDGTQLRALGAGSTYEEAIKNAQNNGAFKDWGLDALPSNGVVMPTFTSTNAATNTQPAKTATDDDIRAWIAQNPYSEDQLGKYVTTMQSHGVTPERLASVMGWNTNDVVKAYNSYLPESSKAPLVKMVIPKVIPQNPNSGLMSSSGLSLPTDFNSNELRTAAIANSDSPIVRQAMARAMQSMNGRGLLNSSMATQAAQEAAIAKALEIAAPDTAAYYTDQRDAKQFGYNKELTQLKGDMDFRTASALARLNNELSIANAQAQYDMKVGDVTQTNYITMIDRIQQDTTKQVQQINSSAMPYEEKQAAIRNIQAQAQAQIDNANRLFKSTNGWQDQWAVAADTYSWQVEGVPEKPASTTTTSESEWG